MIEYLPVSTTTTTTSTTTTSTTRTSTTTTKTTTTAKTTTTHASTTTRTTTTSTSTTIPGMGSFKKPVIITGNGFWDILFASSLGYPLIVWNETDDFSMNQTSIFVERYGPDAILSMVGNISFENKRTYVVEKGYFKNKSNGFVIVDDNKTNALLSGFLARAMNYTLLPANELEGYEFSKNTICDFSFGGCNISIVGEEQIYDYIFNLTSSGETGFDNIVLVNSVRNESALSPLLGKGSIPLVISIEENYIGTAEEINQKNMIGVSVEKVESLISRLISKKLAAKHYFFDGNFFLSMIGIPYAVAEDPWQDDFGQVTDGDILFTDNPYYDVQKDGYPDLSVGRFCCSPSEISLQISNPLVADTVTKKSLILAEYRLPMYMDLFAFDGMTEGFMTEWLLRQYDFDSKRLIENRSGDIDNTFLEEFGDEIKKETKTEILEMLQPEFWLEKAYDFLGWTRLTDFKYGVLEYDWNAYDVPPKKLGGLSYENFIRNKEFGPLVFYYGTGNSSSWYFPDYNNTSLTEPYQNIIWSGDFEFSEPKIVFDEHSLSAHPESEFIRRNNLMLIGSTGIVHDTYTGNTLAVFLRNAMQGMPLGRALMETKRIIFESDNASDGGGIPTSMTLLRGIKLMQKENLQKMIYGDPRIGIMSPEEWNVSSYKLFSQDDVIHAGINMDFGVEKISIVLENLSYDHYKFAEIPEYYLYEHGKPVVPVFTRNFIIPSGSELLGINCSNSSYEIVSSPLIFYSDYINNISDINNTIFPENDFWLDMEKLLDGRTKITANFAPLRYENISGICNAIITNYSIDISYMSPLEILDFWHEKQGMIISLNFFAKASGNFNASISIIGNNFSERLEKVFNFSGSEEGNIKWTAPRPGKYLIRMVLFSELSTAGPREITVKIDNATTTTTIYEFPKASDYFIGKLSKTASPEKIEETAYSAFEKAYYSTDQKGRFFVYQNPSTYLEIKETSSNVSKLLKNFRYELFIFSDSESQNYELKNAAGYIKKSIVNGQIEEVCNNNCEKMRILLGESLSDYNNLVYELRNRMETGELPVTYSFN